MDTTGLTLIEGNEECTFCGKPRPVLCEVQHTYEPMSTLVCLTCAEAIVRKFKEAKDANK